MKQKSFIITAIASFMLFSQVTAQSGNQDSLQNSKGNVGSRATPAGTLGQGAQSNPPSATAAQGATNNQVTPGSQQQASTPAQPGGNMGNEQNVRVDATTGQGAGNSGVNKGDGENAPGGSTDYTNRPNKRSNSGNWGMLGLLGLAGLIGYTMRADLRKPEK